MHRWRNVWLDSPNLSLVALGRRGADNILGYASQAKTLPPKLLRQLFGGLRLPAASYLAGRQMYQSRLELSFEDLGSLNQLCRWEVWLTTRSRMTRRPREW